jgi:O-antigen ligase
MTALAYAALWFFIFAVPWENIIVVPGLGTISRVMGIVALGFVLMAVLVTGRLRRLQFFHIAALLFVVWAGLSVFRTGDETRAITKFITYFQLLLVLWMIWELASTFHRVQGLFFAYVCGAYVAAFNTIIGYRENLHVAKAASRFAAEGFDPNDLGMTLALALPMAWYLGMTYRHPVLRWLCRLYIPMGLVAIGLTASRGALIASIIALLIVPMTMSQLSPGKIAAAIILLFASGAVAVAYIPATSWQRFATTRTQVESGTMNSRVTIWREGFKAFAKAPILGYGTSSFNWTVHSQAHNSYLAVLVEQGLVGFVLFALIFIAVLTKVLKMPKMERRFALVLFATVGVAILPLSWDDRKPVWVILALLTSLAGVLATQALNYQAVAPRIPRRPEVFARQPASP